MKKLLILTVVVVVMSLIACTDAQRGKITSLIECYSGGKLIYFGMSTGKVSSEESSDGYNFRDKKTGKFMEVSGNCIITYDI